MLVFGERFACVRRIRKWEGDLTDMRRERKANRVGYMSGMRIVSIIG